MALQLNIDTLTTEDVNQLLYSFLATSSMGSRIAAMLCGR